MVPKNVSEKPIFLLLFFEHAYPSNRHMYILDILSMH